jgi:hypothetical protein
MHYVVIVRPENDEYYDNLMHYFSDRSKRCVGGRDRGKFGLWVGSVEDRVDGNRVTYLINLFDTKGDFFKGNMPSRCLRLYIGENEKDCRKEEHFLELNDDLMKNLGELIEANK